MTESVQVTGEVSQINLATAEKSGTITMTQLQNVAVKGRDMFAYMITIPGVVDNMSQARETTSPDSLRGTFINGSRENAAPASAPPTMVATFSNGNRPARNSARNSAVRGASSEGFTITRLPAASAAISGMIARWNG